MDIKEIALKLQATDRFRLNVSELSAIEFSEALIAELAKQNDPVGSVSLVHASDTWLNGRLYEANPKTYLGAAYFKPVKHGDKLYTLPPTAEQIANETAEACARVYLDTYDLTDIAEAIRSGAWKEFKKL